MDKNERNIGNFHTLGSATKIFDLKWDDISKINRRGKNRIGAAFKNYKSANNFARRFENDCESNTFKPYNRVTCKGVIKFADTDFSDELLDKFCDSNLEKSKVTAVRRMNRRIVSERRSVYHTKREKNDISESRVWPGWVPFITQWKKPKGRNILWWEKSSKVS